MGHSTLGEIQAKLGNVAKAEKLNLEVTIPGTEAANDWDLWYASVAEVDISAAQ